MRISRMIGVVYGAIAILAGMGTALIAPPAQAKIDIPCPQVLCVFPWEIEVSWLPGTGSIHITNCKCEPMDWNISEFCSWARFTSPTSGQLEEGEEVVVTFEYDLNNNCDGRGCEFVVTGRHSVTGVPAVGSPRIVTLAQGGKTLPEICFVPKTLEVSSAPGSRAMQVWNYGCVPTNWSISADCDWVTNIDPSESENELGVDEREGITVFFEANDTCFTRTCTLSVSAPGILEPETAVITQLPGGQPSAMVSPTEFTVTEFGGDVQFTVTNQGCDTLDWGITVNDSWLSIFTTPAPVPLDSGQSQTVLALAAANPVCDSRVGTITITQPFGESITLTVFQALGGTPMVSMTPQTRKVDSDSGWAAFELTNANCGTLRWTASTLTPWITDIVPASGELAPEESIAVSAFYEPNPNTTARNGIITISAPGSDNSGQQFVVNQDAEAFPVLDVSPLSFSADGNPGSTTVTLQNTGTGTLDWTISGACGWITRISPTSGSLLAGEDVEVTVNYNRNTTATPRTCNLTINGSNATGSPQTFALTQTSIEQPRIEVTPLSRSVDSDSGEVLYTVRNIGSGTLDFETDFATNWIASVTPATGTLAAGASTSVAVAYTANESGTSRIATITFRGDQLADGSVSVTLSQGLSEAPLLEIDPPQLSAGPGAGSQTLTITNGRGGAMDWSIAAGCDWVTQLTPSEGTLSGGQSTAVTIGYSGNSDTARTCTLTVTAPDGVDSPKMITLTQAGTSLPLLSLTPQSQELGSGAGVANIILQNTGGSSVVWSAEASCEWVSNITPATGTIAAGANLTLTMEYAANTDLLSRACTISVAAPELVGSPFTATLSQEGSAVVPCGCLGEDGKSGVGGRLGDLLFIGAGVLAMLGASRMRRS